MNTLATHCPAGHELTDGNVYLYKSGRYCKTCHRIRHHKEKG